MLQCYIVHHRSPLTSPRIEPGSLHWEVSVQTLQLNGAAHKMATRYTANISATCQTKELSNVALNFIIFFNWLDLFHYLLLMAVVTEQTKFTCFEKTCSNGVFLKFSIEQPNFLVFTWCGKFHFLFATSVATFKNKLPISGLNSRFLMNSACTSKRTPHFTVTVINLLTLFKKITPIYA
jgi:hypothetical protein